MAQTAKFKEETFEVKKLDRLVKNQYFNAIYKTISASKILFYFTDIIFCNKTKTAI